MNSIRVGRGWSGQEAVGSLERGVDSGIEPVEQGVQAGEFVESASPAPGSAWGVQQAPTPDPV